ncbi:MAG: hypothetical protein AVDCRST_MAG16-1803 [uncultured Frankineae bacterium]|uniref:Uncharacterized protein n=1 Tax=uncultured Frankineae bacterium TaxID=437475 RepID=A0A6J4LT10_9ACTN|nr:MAG: hypothetical protein AVDCRST_MAG16-1803 [uncultured Frankineae bacterium]
MHDRTVLAPLHVQPHGRAGGPQADAVRTDRGAAQLRHEPSGPVEHAGGELRVGREVLVPHGRAAADDDVVGARQHVRQLAADLLLVDEPPGQTGVVQDDDLTAHGVQVAVGGQLTGAQSAAVDDEPVGGQGVQRPLRQAAAGPVQPLLEEPQVARHVDHRDGQREGVAVAGCRVPDGTQLDEPGEGLGPRRPGRRLRVQQHPLAQQHPGGGLVVVQPHQLQQRGASPGRHPVGRLGPVGQPQTSRDGRRRRRRQVARHHLDGVPGLGQAHGARQAEDSRADHDDRPRRCRRQDRTCGTGATTTALFCT